MNNISDEAISVIVERFSKAAHRYYATKYITDNGCVAFNEPEAWGEFVAYGEVLERIALCNHTNPNHYLATYLPRDIYEDAAMGEAISTCYSMGA